MRLHLLAVGTRVPPWVESGFKEYASRLPRHLNLILHEIPPETRRRGSSVEQLRLKESRRLLAALPKGAGLVALDRGGVAWSTEQLADQLSYWLTEGRDFALAVGGPDGLAREFTDHAEAVWSLSPLTFPHALVRVIVAEQLYRAWSILEGLPYHRA